MITVGELFNSAVAQISMCFPDQDREATVDDAVQMLQTFVMIASAFTQKAAEDAQMLDNQVQQPDSGARDGGDRRTRGRRGR